jgi:glycine/D-amino acid oxidase-like deaminating enzyme
VIVIGAGIIGVSIAYHLARLRHSDVLVLDRGLVGEGATAQATGGIRQQFTSEINATLVQRSVGQFIRLQDETGEPFEFRQHGYMFLLSTQEQMTTFAEAVAMQNRLGIPSRLLDPAAILDICPQISASGLLGAAYCATDGSGSPTDAASAYAKAAQRLGVTFRTRCTVRDFLTSQDGRVLGVRTDAGDFEAAVTVLAAGPQSKALGQQIGLTLAVSPHHRQVFVIDAPPWLHRDLPFTVDLGSGAYLHPESGRGLIGGTDRDSEESTDTKVHWHSLPVLLDALVSRWPALESARVMSGWAGLREMTPDDHALVGPIASVPGLWAATGFSGHGFMQAPAVGEAVAQQLLTGHSDVDLSPLRADRFAAGQGLPEAGVF